MNSKWIYPNFKIDDLRNHPKIADLSDVALNILYNRGFRNVDDIDAFLHGDIKHLHDPRLMKDADLATDILMDAIKNDWFIVVYGDYDCDGVSSTTVMTELLQKAGGRVGFYTNDRFRQGYGMMPSGVDELLAMYPETKLIVTVDNGIMAFEGVKYAKDKGLTVVVTDHHEQGAELPIADAVVDPKRHDCEYPFEGLCGAGVAFKLMLLMYYKMGKPLETVYDSLDIVGMATVGDVVPLVDENRILVQKGLDMIKEEKRLAFRALREVFEAKVINAHYTIGFQYVPAINSIGRLDGNPRRAIEMFFESDYEVVKETVSYLKLKNDERKEMTTEQCLEAEAMIQIKGLKHVIVAYSPIFHEGIVGLIAGRLKEEYNRPVFVFGGEHGQLKGSGRGIDGFHLKQALDVLKEKNLILGGGGHAKACGCSLEESMLEGFEKVVNEMAEAVLTEEDFVKKIDVDYVFHPSEVTIDLIDELRTLEPFGEAFAKPTLVVDGFNVDRTFYMGTEKNHVKLTSSDLDMILFREAEYFKSLGEPKRIKAIGYPDINIWNNRVTVQFLIDNKNVQPA
jgi:single-stranded-DNA-specific exonuclease